MVRESQSEKFYYQNDIHTHLDFLFVWRASACMHACMHACVCVCRGSRAVPGSCALGEMQRDETGHAGPWSRRLAEEGRFYNLRFSKIQAARCRCCTLACAQVPFSPLAMPIYAYLCGQCGFRKDVLQKLSDAALTVCPHCGANAFTKQLSAPSFQLKGTGWYATDFKNSGAPAAAPAATEAAGQNGKDGKTSGNADAAPAPAPAPATSAPPAAPAA